MQSLSLVLLVLLAFMSGLKRSTLPSAVLYAFSPSNIACETSVFACVQTSITLLYRSPSVITSTGPETAITVAVGQNLLNRNGRGVTTTEAGKLLLDHCRGILHQVERAKEDMGRVQGALAGRFQGRRARHGHYLNRKVIRPLVRS